MAYLKQKIFTLFFVEFWKYMSFLWEKHIKKWIFLVKNEAIV